MGENPLFQGWSSYCTNFSKKMNLFNSLHEFYEVDSSELDYSTPLGTICFDFSFNGLDIKKIKPKKIKVQDETIIFSWDLAECYVEFLKTSFSPKIPLTMEVEECIVGIWRIKSLCGDLKAVFKVKLVSTSNSILEGNPESGEGIISQSFENDLIKLSIGTEDEDFLAKRAHLKHWMPSRFHNVLKSEVIEYLSNGLEISLPILEKEESVQIQSIVAWAFKEHSDVSTWFAVEQSSEYILNSVNII
jgi:hypothetical protein